MNQEKPGKKWQQIVARAWMDNGFKQKLLKDPMTMLKEEGFEIPPGAEVKVVENTEKQFFLVLPLKPGGDELTVEQLEEVAAGAETAHLYRK
jgi:hypothetical protein